MEYVRHLLLDAHPLALAAILASIIGPIVAILIATKKPKAKVTKTEGIRIEMEDND